jgi:hypothetical protein
MSHHIIFCVEAYRPLDPKRQTELKDCLDWNLVLPFFNQKIIFTENPELVPQDEKVAFIQKNKRVVFSDFSKQQKDSRIKEIK